MTIHKWYAINYVGCTLMRKLQHTTVQQIGPQYGLNLHYAKRYVSLFKNSLHPDYMYLNLFIIQQNNKSTALYAPRTIKLYTLRLPSLFSVTGPPSCLRVSKKTVLFAEKRMRQNHADITKIWQFLKNLTVFLHRVWRTMSLQSGLEVVLMPQFIRLLKRWLCVQHRLDVLHNIPYIAHFLIYSALVRTS